MTDGIGDLHSQDLGSGARNNAGKTPFGLIPLRYQAHSFLRDPNVAQGHQWATVLNALAQFQEGQDVEALYTVMDLMGPREDVWAETAQVFAFGLKKYKAWNWAKGMPWSVPLECAARHLRKMIYGQMVDEESGLSHRGHVGCNVVMLIHYATLGKTVKAFQDLDDRPPALLFGRPAGPLDPLAGTWRMRPEP